MAAAAAAPAVVLLDAVAQSAKPSATPYWELVIITTSSVCMALATIGGITSLTQSHVCDATEDDDVGVCCGRYAPPPLLPLASLFIGVCKAVILLLDRLWAERHFRGIRSRLHQLAAFEGGGKMSATDTFRTTQDVTQNATARRALSTLPRLKRMALLQIVGSVSFFVLIFSLTDLLGSAIWVGGEIGTVGAYYDFSCPKSCSIRNSSVDFTCHAPMENTGYFWVLVLALVGHFVASLMFVFFVAHVLDVHSGKAIVVEGKGIARNILALLVYAQGDNTNHEFNDFLVRYMKWTQDVDHTRTSVEAVGAGGCGCGGGGGDDGGGDGDGVDSRSGPADGGSGGGVAVISRNHSTSDTVSARGEVGDQAEKLIVLGGSRSRTAVYPVP